MQRRYNPKEIEPKWQAIWHESGTYTADLNSSKPKYIAMSMFNYPSGAGIHIGHAMNYTISDVKARFKRQQGFESYHPVGWDAFGLPAENYAIKSHVSPQQSMAKIIPDYHKQYQAMGWSNDWEKEIATHLPEYYKWTQWIFTQMYKNGLAYQASRMQWWCAIDNTVLANEQVIDGKCWRHDGPDDPLVTKKEIKQWFFKITDYADELLAATDNLDWSESVKLAQKNWIGKSIGAEIKFQVDQSRDLITVFTTRPDTLFGATFLVLAPEHELAKKLTLKQHQQELADYLERTRAKSELERQSEKTKTGIFSGSYAINPINGAKLPIWIADYVLLGYGTGAIMAVPAHDQRDHDFAQRYDLPIIQVIQNDDKDNDCSEKEGVLINSSDFNGQTSLQAKQNIIEFLKTANHAETKINYRMKDWSVSRQRYWGAPIPIIYCNDCGPVLVPDKDLPVVIPELEDFAPSGDGRSALARATDWLKTTCPNCGKPAERETDTLDTYICSSWYMFRYFDPFNQEAIFDSRIVNKWAPIDFYNGGDHATAHLLYARFIGHFFHKLGLINNPEPFKQMLFNGKVVSSDGTMFSKSKGNGIDPLEIIDQGYGADSLRLYLMFAAPLELWTRWDPKGVPGAHRFLSRLWALTHDYLNAPKGEPLDQQIKLLKTITNKTIYKVTNDIEHNYYNTAIAACMSALNDLYKQKAIGLSQNAVWQQAIETIVILIAPFSPHISEQLWHELGHSTTIHHDSWPELDEQYLKSDDLTIAVQVNGKLRGEVTLPSNQTEADIVAAAKADPKVASYLSGHNILKTIYVPSRIVNFVIQA